MTDDGKPKRPPTASDRDRRRVQTPPKGVVEQIKSTEHDHEVTPPLGTDLDELKYRASRTQRATEQTTSTAINTLASVSQLRGEMLAKVDAVDSKVDELAIDVRMLDNKLDENQRTTDQVLGKLEVIHGVFGQVVENRLEVQTQTVTTGLKIAEKRALSEIEDEADAKKTRRKITRTAAGIIGALGAGLGTLITSLAHGC